MSKLHMALAAVVAATALVVVGPAAAQRGDSPESVSGGVQISVHTHSTGAGLLFPIDRLSFDFSEGDDFSYSSRTCAGNARFNDVGLDFRPDYPGVDDEDGTAAVRHRAEGTVTEVNGDRGTIEGTITTVLCEGQTESEQQIVSDYRAKYRRVSDNKVQLTGRFTISPTESTGTFEDLTGGGSFKAILTCLPHERNPDAPTCEDLGEFTDFVGLRGDTSKPPGEATPGLKGNYRDTTVETR